MQVPVFIVAPLAAALMATAAAATEEIPPGDRLPPVEAPAEPPLEGPGGPGAEGPGAADPAAAAADSEAAQAAHLDALFAELANPENRNWELTQAQIYAAWEQSGSSSMDLLADRADRAMERQDLDTALTFLNDLVRLAPDFAEGWNKRATVYFLRDQYARSLEDIARTLELEPRHFGAYAGLGIILDRLGDKKGALEAYRRAVEIHPHLPGAADGIRKLTREVEGERT
jgi:tetratricopeptide (TPR) repeat protein